MSNIFTKKTFIVLAFLGFASSSFSQNLFPTDPVYYAGFENTTAMWYSGANANGVSCTNSIEEKIGGQRSTKFYNSGITTFDATSTGSASFVLGGNTTAYEVANIKNVAAGNYTFKAKVLVKDQAPKQLTIHLAERAATATSVGPFYAPINNVASEVWQTITGNITLATAIADLKISCRIQYSDYAGMTGQSTIYLENMELHAGGPGSTAVRSVKESFEAFVYTNRSNNSLTINAPAGSKVSIINTLGAVMSQQENVSGKLEMSTSSLSNGIYFVNIVSNGNKVVRKISL